MNTSLSSNEWFTPWRAEGLAVYDARGELVAHTGITGNCSMQGAQLERMAQMIADAVNGAADEIERLQRERDEYRECAKSQADRAWQRLSDEPSDDLYGLLVRRGYAQHEAHAIAFGERLAVFAEPPSSAPNVEPPSDKYGRRESPHGYAYRYHDYRGDVLRFNNGEEVNGGKPFETVPYWIGAAVTKNSRPMCVFEDCDGDPEEGSEYCTGHREQERKLTGHYPECGVYEGTQRGPCTCCGTEWTPNVAPIARVEIIGGEVSQTEIYAPGLPDGAHDLFPVPPNERLAALELELATIKKYARQCDLDAAAYELIEIEDRASATKEESR